MKKATNNTVGNILLVALIITIAFCIAQAVQSNKRLSDLEKFKADWTVKEMYDEHWRNGKPDTLQDVLDKIKHTQNDMDDFKSSIEKYLGIKLVPESSKITPAHYERKPDVPDVMFFSIGPRNKGCNWTNAQGECVK
jgi:hypothetical protein